LIRLLERKNSVMDRRGAATLILLRNREREQSLECRGEKLFHHRAAESLIAGRLIAHQGAVRDGQLDRPLSYPKFPNAKQFQNAGLERSRIDPRVFFGMKPRIDDRLDCRDQTPVVIRANAQGVGDPVRGRPPRQEEKTVGVFAQLLYRAIRPVAQHSGGQSNVCATGIEESRYAGFLGVLLPSLDELAGTFLAQHHTEFLDIRMIQQGGQPVAKSLRQPCHLCRSDTDTPKGRMLGEVMSDNPAIGFQRAGVLNLQLIAEPRVPREGSPKSPGLATLGRTTDMSPVGHGAQPIAGGVFSKEHRAAPRPGINRSHQHGDFCRQGRYLPTSMTSSISSYCRRRSSSSRFLWRSASTSAERVATFSSSLWICRSWHRPCEARFLPSGSRATPQSGACAVRSAREPFHWCRTPVVRIHSAARSRCSSVHRRDSAGPSLRSGQVGPDRRPHSRRFPCPVVGHSFSRLGPDRLRSSHPRASLPFLKAS